MKKNNSKKEVQYACDKCGKEADYNLQNVWKLYSIFGKAGNRDFRLNNEWDGDSNEFYCEKCAKKEEII